MEEPEHFPFHCHMMLSSYSRWGQERGIHDVKDDISDTTEKEMDCS